MIYKNVRVGLIRSGNLIKGRSPPMANPSEATVRRPPPVKAKNKSNQMLSATNFTPCSSKQIPGILDIFPDLALLFLLASTRFKARFGKIIPSERRFELSSGELNIF